MSRNSVIKHAYNVHNTERGTTMWSIMTLSNNLNIKISGVYPALNGSINYIIKTMNMVFRSPLVDHRPCEKR